MAIMIEGETGTGKTLIAHAYTLHPPAAKNLCFPAQGMKMISATPLGPADMMPSLD